MDEEHPPEGRWFCRVCQFRRAEHERDDHQGLVARGLFNLLERNLARQNPVAYSLPFFIRDYFEGVTTGEDGEYEEVSNSKTR